MPKASATTPPLSTAGLIAPMAGVDAPPRPPRAARATASPGLIAQARRAIRRALIAGFIVAPQRVEAPALRPSFDVSSRG